MSLRSDPSKRKKASNQNRYLENPQEGFGLLSRLIGAPATATEVTLEMDQLKKYISQDFMMLSKRQNLPNEAEMFAKLHKAYEDLEDLTGFTALANKSIVAVGGGFSAGKSRFINSLIDDDLLPIDTTPTTAIPSYIGIGESESIYAMNTFNAKIEMDREAVKAISHAFNEKYQVSFSHIIKILMLEKNTFPYQNLVILDTPGYSKSDSLVKGDNTDENIARGHLTQADHLIWLVDVQKGTIPDMDLQFINSLAYPGELFLVLNKADMKPFDDLAKIMKTVEDRLKAAGIKYAGISAYSSASKDRQVLMGDNVMEYLEQMDQKIKYKNIKQSFREILNTFIDYNQQEIYKARETLGFLNEFMVLQEESLGNKEREELSKLVKNNQEIVKRLKLVINDFEKLRETMTAMVEQVLNVLQVKEESLIDLGIPALMRIRKEDVLQTLTEQSILEGMVNRLNSFGAFIECGVGDSVMLPLESIKKKYVLPPEKVFPVGQTCQIRIIEILRNESKAKVVINPKENK